MTDCCRGTFGPLSATSVAGYVRIPTRDLDDMPAIESTLAIGWRRWVAVQDRRDAWRRRRAHWQAERRRQP